MSTETLEELKALRLRAPVSAEYVSARGTAFAKFNEGRFEQWVNGKWQEVDACRVYGRSMADVDALIEEKEAVEDLRQALRASNAKLRHNAESSQKAAPLLHEGGQGMKFSQIKNGDTVTCRQCFGEKLLIFVGALTLEEGGNNAAVLHNSDLVPVRTEDLELARGGNMKDVMIDAEWLGERIASVALVMFDRKTGETGAEYYARIKWANKRDQTGSLCPETVYWWFTQHQAARDELTDKQGRTPIHQAAAEIKEFIGDHRPTEFWQRGDSDRATIEKAMWPLGGAPWEFRQWNDVRTLTKLRPSDHRGDHHALNDCKAQIKQLMEALTCLGQV